jgi:hypothetical protein
MTTALILFAIAAITLIVFAPRRSKHIDDPATRTFAANERMHRWRRRLDSQLGTESEDVLRLQAQGAIVKRRLLADARNRAGKALAKLEHAAHPEAAAAPVPVIVRRPKLTLAR